MSSSRAVPRCQGLEPGGAARERQLSGPAEHVCQPRVAWRGLGFRVYGFGVLGFTGLGFSFRV